MERGKLSLATKSQGTERPVLEESPKSKPLRVVAKSVVGELSESGPKTGKWIELGRALDI